MTEELKIGEEAQRVMSEIPAEFSDDYKLPQPFPYLLSRDEDIFYAEDIAIGTRFSSCGSTVSLAEVALVRLLLDLKNCYEIDDPKELDSDRYALWENLCDYFEKIV
jgi:hypothetical protein